MKYKFIDDLTSDVMFESYGKTLKEVFENAAEALFSVICDIKNVKPKQEKTIEVKGRDEKELMLNWLQELIAAVDVDEMFFSKFEIAEISSKKLKAICYGESTAPEKSGTVVKGVTYYNFIFEKTKDGFKARVALDI